MSAFIWVHEDSLRDDHPVHAAAGSDARAVFIWDNNYFRAQGYTAKRLIFIAECLSNMTVEVFAGNTEDVLRTLADNSPIFTAETPNPVFRSMIDTLKIAAVADTPLADIDPGADLGRFFRYWKKASKSVMSVDGLPDGQEDSRE